MIDKKVGVHDDDDDDDDDSYLRPETSHRVWGRAKLMSVPQNSKSYLK
jgi:hypothetical protein